MNINDAREVIKIIEEESFSVLFLLSLIFLPFVLVKWGSLFPESWGVWVKLIIIISWFVALIMRWKEIKMWRRKTILVNYLKKCKQHSIRFLSTEWEAKKEFTEKSINNLLLKYPDELKRVTMKKDRLPGVGLVSMAKEEKTSN